MVKMNLITRRGIAPTPHNGDENTTLSQPKADDNDEDKHHDSTVSNSTHDSGTPTAQHPPPCGGSRMLTLNDDASTYTKAQCLYLVTTTRHAHHLT